MSASRLANGGRIDRATPLNFTWDGKALQGYQGDTLASALLANNQQVLARSFKYHRPRGILSAGVEESGALITLGAGAHRDPNVKATEVELFEGLIASGQNAWPSVRHDFGAINNLFSRFLSAGFYYKTFMGLPPFETGKGTWLWMQYEKIIRKAAGMGEASRLPDPDNYEHGHLFCDLLVVGAGVAGMSAAISAAEQGLDVVLVEQDCQLGGDLLGQNNDAQLTQLVNALAASTVRTMTRTTAFGLYDNGTAGLLEKVTDHLSDREKTTNPYLPRQRFWTLRAAQTILATGAIERHIAFDNNDTPGIMSAASGRHYLHRYGVLSGQNIVLSGNNDSLYDGAIELAQAGAAVAILDARSTIHQDLQAQTNEHGITVTLNTLAGAAHGGKSLSSINTTSPLNNTHWQINGRQDCDSLLVSGGWSPVINLISHRGIRPQWNADNACFMVADAQLGIHLVGSAAAYWNTADCIASAQQAATQVAHTLGKNIATAKQHFSAPRGGWATPIKAVYEIKIAQRKTKSFVDFQHDVTSDDVRLAHQEGFVSVEHLKRYTTLGMATDGGKMGNVIGLALMAQALGKDIPEVGTTVFRPPYTPVAIGALAGRSTHQHFKPLRRTPMHDWNLRHGATMTMAGLWHRPWYYPKDRYYPKEKETINQAYIRETITTRNAVGLCDVTSLGKIAIQGPDASQLLNRIYTNPFAKLAIGKARYGVMLRDDGVVMDDGTTWRLSENDYFMTTTTVNAAKVMVWLEELLQTRWADLKVHVTSVSEQWAGCAVAGPKSRDTLSAVVSDANSVSNQALPFMGVIETTLRGDIPCRIARISFSGERAYEVYVPSDYAQAMMTQLFAEAEKFDGCCYGLEALGAMRIEKGHVTSAELDGRVTLDDAGLGKMASPNKSFIGSSLRQRPELCKTDRPQLVGFFPKDKRQTFNAGAIICAADAVSGTGIGWVTGVTHSPTLGHWIGVGFIQGGHSAWTEQSAIAADPVRNSQVAVDIVSPHMVDPTGARMHD